MFAVRGHWLLFSLAAVLSIAISLAIVGEVTTQPLGRATPLTDLLLPAPPGWVLAFHELAETPEGRAAVKTLLNYDDAVYATYSNERTCINIYIAYWHPGKMSPRLIAGHTPDVCWVDVGWLVRMSRTNSTLASGNVRLKPAEERLMAYQGHDVGVLFWHLVGDRIAGYGPSLPPWYAMFTDVFSYGLNNKDEQYFVRLSCAGEVECWWDNPIVQQLARRWTMLRCQPDALSGSL